MSMFDKNIILLDLIFSYNFNAGFSLNTFFVHKKKKKIRQYNGSAATDMTVLIVMFLVLKQK